jgi:signal transduction histidine kinase
MRERVAVYGGTLSTTHAIGEGFVVRASFPIPQQVR